MPADILEHVEDAFGRHRGRMEPVFDLKTPRLIHGQFREGADLFFGLHPNKSVVERPVAPPHTHDYLEIMYVRKGVCHQLIGGQALACPEGSFLLLSGDACHQPWVETAGDVVVNMGVRQEAARRLLLQASGRGSGRADALLNALFGRQGARRPFLRVDNSRCIDALVSEMFCEYFAQRDLYEQVMLSDFARLLIELCRLEAAPAAPRLEEMEAGAAAQAIRDYICENYAHLTMERLCAHFHYSERHMRRLIRAFTDDSLPDMLNRLKIEKACEYLDRDGLPAAEICSRVGYGDVGYFYRAFKSVKGVSVTDYRHKNLS